MFRGVLKAARATGGVRSAAPFCTQQQSRWYTAPEDFYERLGVSRSAAQADIKKAYKKKALDLHPDRNPDKEAAEQFASINEAYSIISDPEKRKLYDTYGKEAAEQGGMGGGMGGMGGMGGFGGMDPFSDMFGGGGARRQRKAEDTSLEVPVTLEILYKGGEHAVRYSRSVLCPAGKNVKTCTSCNGQGVKVRTIQVGPGMFQQAQEACQACGSSGFTTPERCPSGCDCGGTCVKRKVEQIGVPIKPGQDVSEGMRVPSMGDEGVGIAAGDLIIKMKLKADARLKLVGKDLYTTAKIPLKDAIAGCTLNLPHPSGSTLQLEIPAKELPTLHHTRVIKSQGMPSSGQTFGDYLVDVEVVYPELTEEQV